MTNLDLKYSKAYVEVLELLKYMPEKIVKLIPKEEIEMFKEFKNKSYIFKYDKSLSLKQQKISDETKAIFAYLYNDYILPKLNTR